MAQASLLSFRRTTTAPRTLSIAAFSLPGHKGQSGANVKLTIVQSSSFAGMHRDHGVVRDRNRPQSSKSRCPPPFHTKSEQNNCINIIIVLFQAQSSLWLSRMSQTPLSGEWIPVLGTSDGP